MKSERQHTIAGLLILGSLIVGIWLGILLIEKSTAGDKINPFLSIIIVLAVALVAATIMVAIVTPDQQDQGR